MVNNKKVMSDNTQPKASVAEAFGNAKKAKTINGIIKKIIFQNAESGFTVLNVFSNDKFITASGTFFDKPLMDSKIKLKGEFTYHKKYGYQFNFTQYEVSLSNTKTAIIEYLSSSIFKGIGKAIAREIYDKFKEKTLDVIDDEPEKLKDVNGIGAIKLAVILEGLKESYGLRKTVMFFKPYQFSDYQIKAIYNRFKDKSVTIAKENPYLFTDIKGIGFKKADIMSEKLGIKKDDPNRIKEAIKYVVNQICESSGNCYIYYQDVKKGIGEIIEDLEETDLKKYLNDLIKERKLLLDFKGIYGTDNYLSVVRDRYVSSKSIDLKGEEVLDFTSAKEGKRLGCARIYMPVYYHCELGAAKELKRIRESASPASDKIESLDDLDKFLELGNNHVSLTNEQKTAVLNALKYKISIISGGPGTGKSTIIKTIVHLYSGEKIALTSLAGKAAQRLADIVNSGQTLSSRNDHSQEKMGRLNISTIHRLLKAQYDRQTGESYFTYNERNRLPHDLIVIDEMSMIDIIIFYKLLKAIKDDANIVFVGDVNQIPAVSPGDVLRDLIYAGAGNMDGQDKTKPFFPSTFLTKVFRQNEGGLINLNAHNILNNKKFVTLRKDCKEKNISTAEKDDSFTIKYRKEYDIAVGGKHELLIDFTRFIKRVVENRINKRDVGLKSANMSIPTMLFDDIQVLTPMRRGDLGYFNLNNILQDIFNPISPLHLSASVENIFICNGIQFRLYDKVIQKRNNYDQDVFNGDTGYIVDVNHNEKYLTVDFSNYSDLSKKCNEIGTGAESCANLTAQEGKMTNKAIKLVKYNFLDVYENISTAYALSIHKAQGSEFNNVIVLFHQTHYMMLKKNLLYTAITRGKKNIVIFGTFKAIGIAMGSKETVRNSGLKDRLSEEFLDAN